MESKVLEIPDEPKTLESIEETFGHELGETIERVIRQEDAKTYTAKVVLGWLDAPGFDFTQAQVLLPEGALPIWAEDGRRIGHASIDATGRRLLADLFIDFATPERLSIEAGERLWARPLGGWDWEDQEVPEESYELAGDVLWALNLVPHVAKVVDVWLDGIVLVRQAPRDHRIEPIGQPIP